MKDFEVLCTVPSILNFAESIPPEALVIKNTELLYPSAIGEYVVSHVPGLLLYHESLWQEYLV